MALTAPVVVVGSLRGELQDLLTIFRISGPVPETSYLFLGDYTVSGGCAKSTGFEDDAEISRFGRNCGS